MRLKLVLPWFLGALLICAYLAAPTPAATTQFNFAGGDLSAQYGPGTLSYLNDTAIYVDYGKASDFGAPTLPGGNPDVMHFQAFNTVTDIYDIVTWAGAQAIEFDTAGAASPGYNRINQYTFVFDLLVPQIDVSYMALFDCQPDQLKPGPPQYRGGDAEFFVKRTSTGPPPVAGIGISGNYTGTIYENEWHRIAVTVDCLLPPGGGYPYAWGSEMHKYLDGVELAIPAGNQIYQDSKGGPDMRFSLGRGPATPGGDGGFNYWPFLFYDLDPETNDGILSSMYFADRVLSATEIAALSGPNAAGIFNPGDANNDGIVDLLDLGVVGDNWNGTGKKWAEGDFNGDGTVDLLDLGVVGDNWNTVYFPTPVSTVPEPSTLTLLVLGALAAIFYRRRRFSL